MKSIGESLIELLEAYGVEYVFGIPGVHTAELYRGLAESSMQHVTPRHEQAAGFMADGYARVSGKPGVCLVITGPGLSNIATAMLQAQADSIAMLVISTVNDPDNATRGRLHEMPDQMQLSHAISCLSFMPRNGEELAAALSSAFQQFNLRRPGPVHIQLPLGLLEAQSSSLLQPAPSTIPAQLHTNHAVDSESSIISSIDQAIGLIQASSDTAIVVGGGARLAAAQIQQLAESIECPVVTTINARSWFPIDHPLVLHASPSLKAVSDFLCAKSLIVAIGTELGPTDFDMFDNLGTRTYQQLIRIDIDADQCQLNASPDIALHGDASQMVNLLLERLGGISAQHAEQHDMVVSSPDAQLMSRLGELDAACNVKRLNATVRRQLSEIYQSYCDWLEQLAAAVSDIIFVGDSTQLIYACNLSLNIGHRGGWFNSAVGFGTLGYALSAGIGAKLAAPDKPVVVIIGDGGLQFTLAELGTLRDLDLPLVIVVWNNNGYGEIKQFMLDKQVQPIGVDLLAPDFVAIAKAYAIDAERVDSLQDLQQLVLQNLENRQTVLLEYQMPLRQAGVAS